MPDVPVLLFADFTCPYSYVTEAALWRRVRGGGMTLTCRAFELHPAPAELPTPDRELPEALIALADAEMVELTPSAHCPRTAKAHELAKLAAERGVERLVRLALYEAYWARDEDLARVDVLSAIGAGCGLDAEDVKIALDIDRYVSAVTRDREAAVRLGVEGTPAVIVGTGERAELLLGAFPYAALDAAVARH